MAVIGNIRRRSGLLIIIIGLAMLAFILGDIFGNGGLLGGGQGPSSVGNIAGMEVDQIELEKSTEYWSTLSKKYYGPITDEQARRRAWDNMVFEKVTAKEIENSGLSFTTTEFDEIRFGDNVSQDIQNAEIYKDENGQFSTQRVEDIWQNWSTNLPDLWTAERNRMSKDRLTKKYNALVSNGMISNSLEAADSYAAKNVTMEVQYVSKPFSSIVDSTVTITDSDLQAFYNAHKDEIKYEQKAERDLEIVSFPVSATPADIEAIRGDIESLKTEFAESLNDSTYSIVFNDMKQYVVSSYGRADIDSLHANDVFSAADGTVVGPYRVGETFKLYKVISDDIDETASVQHILLKSPTENEEISARADSILRALKRGADFAGLAEKYTEDRPGYDTNKGLYADFGKGEMVPEFESFAFENNPGSMGVVKTTFGYHIMEVTDRKSTPQKKVVELVKFIRPSSETLDIVYEEASNFSIDNGNLEKFRSGAETKGYAVKPNKGIAPGAKVVGGIPDSRSIARWAYKTDRAVGDVSQPIEFDDQFVIAALTSIREEGVPTFEDAKEKMRTEVIKEKKAEMIMADLGSISGLSEAADAWGATTNTGTAISLNSPKIGGNEPTVVAAAISGEPGSIVGPVKGTQGIYVVQIDSKNEVDLESVNLESEVSTLQNSLRSTVGIRLNNAITKAKGVKNEIDRLY